MIPLYLITHHIVDIYLLVIQVVLVKIYLYGICTIITESLSVRSNWHSSNSTIEHLWLFPDLLLSLTIYLISSRHCSIIKLIIINLLFCYVFNHLLRYVLKHLPLSVIEKQRFRSIYFCGYFNLSRYCILYTNL